MFKEGRVILENRFVIIQLLAQEQGVEVYELKEPRNGKFYTAKVTALKHKQRLNIEAKALHKLRTFGIVPQLRYVGIEKTKEKDFFVIVMEKLGKSLEELLQEFYGNFDLITVLHLAVRLISMMQSMHGRRILSRNVNPQNLMLGSQPNKKDKVYFGNLVHAKCHSTQEGDHIPYKEGKNLLIQSDFASLNNHRGQEQSRRDDLESIGYILLYLLKGTLPWIGLSQQGTLLKKIELDLDMVCEGAPDELKEYIAYCRRLNFSEFPDYDYLLGLFEGCLLRKEENISKSNFIWNRSQHQQDILRLHNKTLNKQKNKNSMYMILNIKDVEENKVQISTPLEMKPDGNLFRKRVNKSVELLSTHEHYSLGLDFKQTNTRDKLEVDSTLAIRNGLPNINKEQNRQIIEAINHNKNFLEDNLYPHQAPLLEKVEKAPGFFNSKPIFYALSGKLHFQDRKKRPPSLVKYRTNKRMKEDDYDFL